MITTHVIQRLKNALRPTRFSSGFRPIATRGGVVATCLLGGLAIANPDGPTVVAGSATFGGTGSELSVTNTPGTIINWQSFSISPSEITRFTQNSANSAVLNRVIGLENSRLLGQLLSNGRVFLVNPNGIVVGNGARIDTAGFIASTLDIADADFLAGNYHFSGDGGSIVNYGTITSGPGGEVVLIAPSVENSGVINARDGEIILAAGREVTLTSLDNENLSYRFSAPADRAVNLGDLIAQNGAIGVFAGQVASQGDISADRISLDSAGRVVLHADGSTTVGGNVSAQGSGVPGGDIAILGNDIRLAGASVDASGTNGGRVRIGGSFQGRGDLPAASRVQVDQASVVHADALQNGSGGRIIVWSEQSTRSFGRLTARGGSVSGNGGLVETSSRGNLAFGQPADVSAIGGEAGTWLLDPEDIVIDSAGAESISSALDAGSNVQIQTAEGGTGEGNITVSAPIRKTTGPDAALGLTAHGRIDVNAPIESIAGRLSVSLRAGRDIAVNAPITTNGGNYSAVIDASLAGLPDTDPEAADEGGESADDAGETDTATLDEETLSDPADDMPANGDETAAAEEDAAEEAGAILTQGISQLADIHTGGGDIELDAGAGGLLTLNATIDAVNTDSDETGGSIHLLGEQVGLFDDALVDASGHGGGGEVLIGGGQQGLDPEISNADAVYIASTAAVHADGLESGDGGTVIVYAEDVTNVLGDITARGGEQGGDGGFVETSANKLRVDKAPDVSADNGQGGTWLIDPDEINIVSDRDVLPPLSSPFTSSGDTSIEVQQIGQALAGGDVVISTGTTNTAGSGNINWLARLDLEEYGSDSSPIGSLTLNAHNDIHFTAGIEGSSSSSDQRLQNLTLDAGGEVAFDGSGGAIHIDVNQDINISAAKLRLTSGSASGQNVRVNARDQLLVSVSDSIIVQGAAGNDAQLAGSGSNSSIQTGNLMLGDGGELFVNTGSTISVSDTLTMMGGSLTSNGSTLVNNMTFKSGTIDGFTSDNSDFFQTGGTVLLSTDADKNILQNWIIADGAVVDWMDGNIILGADIENSGVFNAHGDNWMTTRENSDLVLIPPGDFNNRAGGTFSKTASSGDSTVFMGVDFNNAGNLEARAGDIQFGELDYIDFNNQITATGGRFLQSGGVTLLAGGTISANEAEYVSNPNTIGGELIITGVASTLRYEGGSLNGGVSDTITTGGSINANVDLRDTTVNPGHSPGTLTINGDLVAGAGSVFNVELSDTAAGQYDLLQVSGNATLDGSTFNLVFDGYTPPTAGGTQHNFDILIAETLTANGITVVQPVLPDGTVADFGQVGGALRVGYTGGGGAGPGPRNTGPTPPGSGPNPLQPPTPVRPGDPGVADPVQPPPGEGPTQSFDATPWLISLFRQIPEVNADDQAPEFLQCF